MWCVLIFQRPGRLPTRRGGKGRWRSCRGESKIRVWSNGETCKHMWFIFFDPDKKIGRINLANRDSALVVEPIPHFLCHFFCCIVSEREDLEHSILDIPYGNHGHSIVLGMAI
jgi:hypothetical protein